MAPRSKLSVLQLPAGPETEAEQRLREQDLEGHITQKDASGQPLAQPAEEPRDAQLERAREVLKSWTYFDRFRRAPGTAPSQTAEAGAAAAP